MAKTLSVHSLLYYLTEIEGITWRSGDWATNKIVKALKGEEIKGYFQLDIKGTTKSFDQSNIGTFLPILFSAVAKKMKETIDGDFTLVPIPNSSATIKDKNDFRTLEHARAVAAAVGSRASVSAALRWKEEKFPAHKGGSRDPQIHFDNLGVVEKPTGKIVIFDDVLTTGSQMIGSYRRLLKAGVKPICGFVVGRATKEQHPKMINWHSEEIQVEDTPIDWDAILKKSL